MSENEKAILPEVAAFEEFKSTDVKETEQIIRLIKQGRLPWEMVLPKTGSSLEVWKALGERMPIMALIRNLRNLHECGALDDSALKHHIVYDMLRNPAVILKSKQLPFRWYSAWNIMKDLDCEIADALVDSLRISVNNLPFLEGMSIIGCDNSGSMSGSPISSASTLFPIDIAALLGAIARNICENSRVLAFGTDISRVMISEHDSILTNMDRIKNTDVGHSTNAYKIMEYLIENDLFTDRIIILTDMQIYSSEGKYFRGNDFNALLDLYREEINPSVITYIINLQPYEHFMLPQDKNNVVVISGWNQGILRYIKYSDNMKGGSLVDQVNMIAI